MRATLGNSSRFALPSHYDVRPYHGRQYWEVERYTRSLVKSQNWQAHHRASSITMTSFTVDMLLVPLIGVIKSENEITTRGVASIYE